MACSGTFSEQAVIPAIGAVKIPNDVPLEIGALIGCGVLTGVGAALNTANIKRGRHASRSSAAAASGST